jgi:hypothetical protein
MLEKMEILDETNRIHQREAILMKLSARRMKKNKKTKNSKIKVKIY